MKKIIFLLVITAAVIKAFSQSAPPVSGNTLLWRISGKNLTSPSYLFGTIHMVCTDDIELSDSLKEAIQKSDKVFLELDMDNLLEALGAMRKMKMRNDTTLADLLTPAEYEKVKTFFNTKGSMLPFSVLETYKPMLTASTLMQGAINCKNAVAMEQLIMQQAKKDGKKIRGLETMAYQISIFDSIPYLLQAKELLSYIENYDVDDKAAKEYDEMITAYRNQQLDKLESLTKTEELGMGRFADLLLYNRNVAWVKTMEELMPEGPLLFAVGAGHLPGEKGVIRLLRKAGFTVEPVRNDMIRKNTRVI